MCLCLFYSPPTPDGNIWLFSCYMLRFLHRLVPTFVCLYTTCCTVGLSEPFTWKQLGKCEVLLKGAAESVDSYLWVPFTLSHYTWPTVKIKISIRAALMAFNTSESKLWTHIYYIIMAATQQLLYSVFQISGSNCNLITLLNRVGCSLKYDTINIT